MALLPIVDVTGQRGRIAGVPRLRDSRPLGKGDRKMQRQNFFGMIRFSRVLSLSLLVVVLGGLLKPEAAVQPVSFGAKTDFGTGTEPFSVAVGDFNGDGIKDLAVTNYASDTVSILLGTGTGSFGPKTDFGTDLNPQSVAVGDFNSDGKLDLAVSNFVATVSILLKD